MKSQSRCHYSLINSRAADGLALFKHHETRDLSVYSYVTDIIASRLTERDVGSMIKSDDKAAVLRQLINLSLVQVYCTKPTEYNAYLLIHVSPLHVHRE